MLILVDVDDTVANLVERWLEKYNYFYHDDLKKSDIRSWAIHEYVKPECGRDIYGFLSTGSMYDDIKPIEGALDGIQALRDLGHRVVFVTSYFNEQKVLWLQRHGLLIDYPYKDGRWQTARDVIMANDKSMIKGDLLIDDRTENIQSFRVHNTGILFTQPWNESFPALKRADDWTEVVALVKWL